MPALAEACTGPSTETAIFSLADTAQFTLAGSEADVSTCKIADCTREWEAAFRLVHDCYVRKGLIRAKSEGCRVTRHHLLPATNTFIAKQNEETRCTVTLVGDSEAGLPLEALYPEEIERKRTQGHTLGEVTCLASRISSRSDFLPLFLDLMKLMCQHARCFGLDQLLIAAHPKHARFYERNMGYRQFGTEKTYPCLHDAPVIACCLDFRDIDRRRPRFYDHVFEDELPLWQLLPHPMPPDAVDYFKPMVDAGGHLLPMLT